MPRLPTDLHFATIVHLLNFHLSCARSDRILSVDQVYHPLRSWNYDMSANEHVARKQERSFDKGAAQNLEDITLPSDDSGRTDWRGRFFFSVAIALVVVLSSAAVAICFFTLPINGWLLRLEGYSVTIEDSKTFSSEDTLQVAYTMRNLTNSTATIVEVKPCCGARVLSEIPLQIPPGDSKEVLVRPPLAENVRGGEMEVQFFVDRQSLPLVVRTTLVDGSQKTTSP